MQHASPGSCSWRGRLPDPVQRRAGVARRLSALSSFYRFAAAHDLRSDNPVIGVRRPAVDPDHTRTVGLTRQQARALVAAANVDPGPQRARSAALVRLLHNGLRGRRAHRGRRRRPRHPPRAQ